MNILTKLWFTLHLLIITLVSHKAITPLDLPYIVVLISFPRALNLITSIANILQQLEVCLGIHEIRDKIICRHHT